ncbi:MAG: c-type cytochrome [Candidatus Competibacterales bacterium]
MKMPLLLTLGLVLTPGLVVAQGGDAVAGKERYLVNCVNCHGRAGKGMASFPAIAGRDADYISDRLRKYRAKEKVGPNSALMMSLVSDLSDDDIANLAAYVAENF